MTSSVCGDRVMDGYIYSTLQGCNCGCLHYRHRHICTAKEAKMSPSPIDALVNDMLYLISDMQHLIYMYMQLYTCTCVPDVATCITDSSQIILKLSDECYHNNKIVFSWHRILALPLACTCIHPYIHNVIYMYNVCGHQRSENALNMNFKRTKMQYMYM